MWDRRRPAAIGNATGRETTATAAVTGAATGLAWAATTQPSAASTFTSSSAAHHNNSKQRLFVPRSKNKNHKADLLHQHSHSHSQSPLHSPLHSHLYKSHLYHSHPQQHANSLTALGITTTDVTYKYRIHKGKTVPASDYPEDPLYTASYDYHSSSASSPEIVPPPRNPRRLQQLRNQTAVAHSRSSSRYSANHSDPESDASPNTIRCGASALEMAQLMATEPVSPPSSPEIAAWRCDSHPETVSPIDEDSDASLDEFVKAINGPRRDPTPPVDDVPRPSQIPVKERDLPALPRDDPPRRALGIEQAPSYQQAALQRKPVSIPGPHWQTQPQRTRIQPRAQPQRTAPQAMIPERDSSFGQRVKQTDTRALLQQSRPTWQGASGREPQVPAMHDDLAVPPLSLPKSDRRTAFKGESHFRARLSQMGSPRVDGPSSAGAAMRKLLTSRTHKKASSLATPSPRAQYSIDRGRQSPGPYPSPPHYDEPQIASTSPSPPLLNYPSQNSAIRRKPPPNAHFHKNSSHAHPLASSPVNQDEIPKPPTPDSPIALQNARGDAWAQPGSRFSITTYATTTGGTPNLTSFENSPAIGMNSSRPSLPSNAGLAIKDDRLESLFSTPFSGQSTLTVEPGMFFLPDKDVKESSRARSHSATETARRSSISSLSKPLPPVPPEVFATDRVSLLSAQLEGLANRRQNINRYINRITDLTPREILLASTEVQKKRELDKKKIESLKGELAEIQREEHELGLLLHRAYKRQNKDAEYEPTTLWVRRVAG